jgi:hypothetical protein
LGWKINKPANKLADAVVSLNDPFNKLPSLGLFRYQMGQFSVLPGSFTAPATHKDPITQHVTNKLNLIPLLRRFCAVSQRGRATIR